MHRSDTPSYPVHSNYAQVAGVVAVEPAGQFFRVFSRNTQGVTFHDYPFTPFFLLSDPGLTDAAPVMVTHHHLAGNGKLCWLTELATWHDWCLLRDYLQALNRPDAWFAIPDSCQQFLIMSGIPFLKGLSWNDLSSLCINIQKDDQSLLVIAVTDGCSYQEVLTGRQLSEAAKLERLTQIIQEQDPDIITGYQLNKYLLPQLISAARQNKLRLAWGRNGAEIHQQQTIEYRGGQRFEVYGRSLVDLKLLVSGHEHVAEDGALAAVTKTMQRYQQVVPAWCQQIQWYPTSFQRLVAGPAVTAVQALMLREYLLQQHAVPALLSDPRQQQHHGTAFFQQGLAAPVIHYSLAHLPAAIVCGYRIATSVDECGLFSRLLQQRVCNGTEPALLVSGWYELLSNTHVLFSDTEAASEVDRLKYVIIRDLLDCLREQGATPVAVDQQGIYFIPAPGSQDGSTEIHLLWQCLRMILPDTPDLPAIRTYQSIFIYKPSQFALLDNEGNLFYRGSSFTSHAREPFLREFLMEAVKLLLTDQGQAVEQLYEGFIRRLTESGCPVSWVMRSEALPDSKEQYEQAVASKKRNRAAAYELAIAKRGTWQSGDTISYYVIGRAKNCVVHENCKLVTDFNPQQPDLNKPWYLERLHQLFKRLQPFLPAEPLLFT